MSDLSESYGAFLREAVARYWNTRKGRRVRFLALLLASREAWEVAVRGAAEPETARRLLTGVASAAGVAMLLRIVVGGPLGVLLTGASVVGLVAVYARSHRDVLAQSARCRELVEAYRPRWREIVDDAAAGTLPDDRRDLLLEGLLGRFLTDLDAEPEAPPEPPVSPHERGGFRDHVEKKRRDPDA